MAKLILLTFMWLVAFGTGAYEIAYASDDCACEEAACNTCEEQVDIKFYTAKCDQGKKVKSCKKPICQAKADAPKECVAQNKGAAPVVVAEPNKKVLEKNLSVTSASTEVDKKVKAHVGVVVVAQGVGWVTHTGKARERARIGEKIFEQDILETEAEGKIKILFKDKNTMSVTPGSKVQVTEMNFEEGNQDRTMLDLLEGSIRNQVNRRYKGSENNYFRVRTKSAVAGIRGTDFVVSYPNKNLLETKVETLTGKVELVPRTAEDDLGVLLEKEDNKNKVEIPKGTYASFVVDNEREPSSAFSKSDIAGFVARGYMTPVYKMSEQEVKELDSRTTYEQTGNTADEAAADVAVTDEKVCATPAAPFNFCAWTCEGNPEGESRCRTELPQVTCKRRRCNANGEWTEDTRMPASYSDVCQPGKSVVKVCDY